MRTRRKTLIAALMAGIARRRRLSAAVGAVAAIGASTVLVASPAYADNVEQWCNTYHSWTECISMDWTNGYLAVNALNGYPTTQAAALWAKRGGVTLGLKGFNIPPHTWAGFPIYMGDQPPFTACAGIDSVQIVCGNFG